MLSDTTANGRLKYLVSLNMFSISSAGITDITTKINPERPKNNNGFFSTAILNIVEPILNASDTDPFFDVFTKPLYLIETGTSIIRKPELSRAASCLYLYSITNGVTLKNRT